MTTRRGQSWVTCGNDWRKNMGYDSAEEQSAPLTTNQPPYANGVDGEVFGDNTAEEPVIPAQRGFLAGRPATSKGELKPILARG